MLDSLKVQEGPAACLLSEGPSGFMRGWGVGRGGGGLVVTQGVLMKKHVLCVRDNKEDTI